MTNFQINFTSLTRSLAIVALLAACSNSPIEDQDTIPQTNEAHNDMLDGLGFDVELGARTDEEGAALPASWHPLGTRHASFYPSLEVYMAGPTFGAGSELLRDDATNEYGALPINSNPDSSWTTARYKDSVAADVDGDGFDEFLIVYFAPGSKSLKYILLDPNDQAAPVMGTLDPGADATNLEAISQPSMAAGDLDGDGVDEVAVGFGKLYVLSNIGTELQVAVKGYPSQNEVMVAIGNTDLDSEDELVVTHTESSKGYYEIIEQGDIENPKVSSDLIVTDKSNQDHSFGETRVAIGDIDGNRVNDILFHGRRIGDDAWMVFLLKYDSYEDDYSLRSYLHHVHNSDQVPWTLVPVDLDGDGIDEVYAWNQVFNIEEDGSTTHYSDMGMYWRGVAGNVDSDRREELVLANGTLFSVYGLNGLDQFVHKHREEASIDGGIAPALAIGNTDADSAMVRYDGQHELLFTAPNLITVMAAPPYQAGIGQDIDSTSTTYGAVESSEVVDSKSMGVSVGFSVGYEYESNIFGFTSGFSAKATFESAFDFHASQSKSRENWYSHTSAPGEDKVVFSTVPFDVYYYTIVSSPNQEEVGRVVTVNMPRNQQVIGSSIEFYNESNGGEMDLDSELMRHRAGDVWSYPSIEDRDQILLQAEMETPGYLGLWNGPLQVDESGSNSLGLSTSEGAARGASMDFSTNFEAEVKAGGFSVGSSVGFHYGYEVEVSTQEGAFYEGSVGAIPGDAYADNSYCYGIMVYPQAAGNQRFTMINYWTQQRCGGQ